MPIVTTKRGLEAIADAEAGGFLVDLEQFAVTDALGVIPRIDDIALEGTILYRAEVQSIEAVGSSRIKVTLFIPPSMPSDGVSKKLTEVGLYLKSGELFAHGTFKTPFDKTNEFGLRVILFVVAARIGDVINFTFGTNASLASAASVRTLVDPTESNTNAVVVMDAVTNDGNVPALTAASLAVRYGAGGMQWAFLGHDLKYRGYPTDVNAGHFVLNAEVTGGFWMNDEEIGIAQIVSGHGGGESRRVKYNKPAGRFEILEKPFSAISTQSLIHIWRNVKYQLPTRNDRISSYYVLGHGENTWKREGLTNEGESRTDLIPMRVHKSGPGQNFPLPSTIPDNSYLDKDNFIVHVGGDLIPVDQFTVNKASGITLISRTAESGEPVEITVFKTVPSSGASLVLASDEYSATGTEWTFNASIVPLSDEYIWPHLDGRLIAPAEYYFQGSSISFTNAAPVGNLVLISAANLEELGAGTTIIRKETTLSVNSGNVSPIDLESNSVEEKNTIITVKGKLLSKSLYEINNGMLILKTGDYQNADPISIIAFASTLDEVLVERSTGIDTGPNWIDPAGRNVEANRVQASAISHVGDGTKTVYSMGSQGSFAFVFIDGTFQDPAPITVQATNGVIILPQALRSGAKMDIISFQAIRDKGQETRCVRDTLTTVSGQKRYTITPAGGEIMRQLSMVSMGGVYQHLGSYSNDGNAIEFEDAPPPGLPLEVWHFGTIEHEGYSNAMSSATNTLRAGTSEYIHEYYNAIPIFDETNVGNTLLFVNTVMQYGSEYSVVNDTAYKFNIPSVSSVAGQKAYSFVFYTGASKTRLMTRTEMGSRYMTREEILKLVAGGIYVPPDPDPDPDPNPDPDPEPGEGGAKALYLSATSQIFAVSNDGTGLPGSIVFTANPQNITGTVSFVVLAGSATISSAGKTATLAYTGMNSEFATIRARVTEGGVSYFDDITVVKLHEGEDSVTAILTNESHTLPSDVAGNVSSYNGASTNMEIYRGTVRETNLWTFERSNSVGVTSTIAQNQVQITALYIDSGFIDITANRDGFSPIVKRFSFSKSKTGVTGPAGAQGAGATYAVLSNETFNFAASSSGVVTDFSRGFTEIKVIRELVDDTSNWTFTTANSEGVSSTITGAVVRVTAFGSAYDTGDVTITASRSGYPTLKRVFSLAKSKGSSGSGSGSEGPRGSMTFYVSGRTSWSDSVAASAASYGSGPRLNDTVVQYSTGYSQTRFWNGSAWVILTQVIDGNLLVRGTVGADAISAGAIKANSALIETGAIGTLMLGGNSVTLAQAIRQGEQKQATISYVGPTDPVTSFADPTGNVVLSMIVNVSGIQPCLVWATWSNPGAYEVFSGGDATYWGKNWKMNGGWSEVVAQFTMRNTLTGAIYKAGFLSSSTVGGYTTSLSTQAIFQGVPEGTYVLSLCMCKSSATLPSFALRGASMAFLETKR